MRTERVSSLVLLALSMGVVAAADSVLVPAVELQEQDAGYYVLEALVSPAISSRIAPPVPPDRCAVGDAERRESAQGVSVRYPIDCENEPLAPRDVLVLPWLVDGIQLTAHWLDGNRRRALFARDPAGVIVPLDSMMEREEGFADLVRTHGAAGWTHFWTSGSHLVFVLALALVGRFAWIGLGGLVAGHAAALVLADAGVAGLARAPADAVAAGAAALLMATLIRERVKAFAIGFVSPLVGLLHGLGVATELVGSGVSSSTLPAALFLNNVSLDLSAALLLVAMTKAATFMGAWRHRMVPAVGIASVFALLAAFHAGLTRAARTGSAGFVAVDAPAPAIPASAVSSTGPSGQLDDDGDLVAPFMSYVLVEPYQVRHEVLVDVEALAAWIDVPVDSAARIPIAAQEPLIIDVVALVTEHAPLSIDGAPASVASARADFVVLGNTGALTREAAIAEPASTAIVGVTLVYRTESIPDSVEIAWGLFSDAADVVPVTVTDPVAVAEAELTPEVPGFEWRNTLGEFQLPAIEAIAATKPRVPLVSFALCLLAVAIFVVAQKRSAAVVCLAVAYAVYPFARVEASIPLIGELRLDRAEASNVIEGLLTNVYRSLGIPSEELIYDRLALTVTGEQLLDVYLESRRALELENREGARVRIDEVVVREVRGVSENDDGGYDLDARWTVGGSVNHFGHVHFRQNEYDATITIVPVEGRWKIRGLELMEERRVL